MVMNDDTHSCTWYCVPCGYHVMYTSTFTPAFCCAHSPLEPENFSFFSLAFATHIIIAKRY
jgi:hypothetical protein